MDRTSRIPRSVQHEIRKLGVDESATVARVQARARDSADTGPPIADELMRDDREKPRPGIGVGGTSSHRRCGRRARRVCRERPDPLNQGGVGSQTVSSLLRPFEGCERASRCFTLTVYTRQQGVGG